LDHAVFRRFDVLVPFVLPTRQQLERLLGLRLSAFALPRAVIGRLARRSVGVSYADASRACEDAIRNMVLDRRTTLAESDVAAALSEVQAAHGTAARSRRGKRQR